MSSFYESFWIVHENFFIIAAAAMGMAGVMIGIVYTMSPLMRRLG
jgi:hypothetical protein